MRRRHPKSFALLLTALVAFAVSPGAAAEPSEAPESTPGAAADLVPKLESEAGLPLVGAATEAAAKAKPGSAALRAYRDPETGAFTAPPANPEGAGPASPRAAGPSDEAAKPEIVESPAPGGGVMVELGDRFLSHMTIRPPAAAPPSDPGDQDVSVE